MFQDLIGDVFPEREQVVLTEQLDVAPVSGDALQPSAELFHQPRFPISELHRHAVAAPYAAFHVESRVELRTRQSYLARVGQEFHALVHDNRGEQAELVIADGDVVVHCVHILKVKG